MAICNAEPAESYSYCHSIFNEEEDFPRLLRALHRSEVVTRVDLTNISGPFPLADAYDRWTQAGRGDLLTELQIYDGL